MPNVIDPLLLTGRLLVLEGLISEGDLESALHNQIGHRALRWPGKSLGTHLVNADLVAAEILETLLFARDAQPVSREEMKLGEIAVRNGLLSPSQLAGCIAAQNAERMSTGRAVPLGKIILRDTSMWEHDLQALLDRQAALLERAQETADDEAA